jgi:hypothetical protein
MDRKCGALADLGFDLAELLPIPLASCVAQFVANGSGHKFSRESMIHGSNSSTAKESPCLAVILSFELARTTLKCPKRFRR